MIRIHRAAAAGWLVLAGLASGIVSEIARAERVPDAKEQLLLDGRCDPREYVGALRMDLGEFHMLQVIRNGRYLALCMPLRDGSLGNLDLFLVTPKEPTPVNLHVSGQLGERVLTVGEWPEMTWWAIRGWAAPWVGLDGFEGEGAQRRPKFHPSEARELFLDLERFGVGTWSFRVELRRLASSTGGQDRTVSFPRDTFSEIPVGWATFEVPDPYASAVPRVAGAVEEGVGFRSFDLVDWSRWREIEKPDVVRAFVWYPAHSSGARPATLGALAGPLAGQLSPAPADAEAARAEIRRWGGALSESAVRGLLSSSTGALVDAPVLEAAKPRAWILLASPLPPWAHDALAERLVRAGYVVAQIRPASARDLALVVLELPEALPGLDPQRLGLIGFGSGASQAAFFAMQHAGLAAWVSLDGAEGWVSGYERLERHPDFQPGRIRAPWLRFQAMGRAAADQRFVESVTALAGWELGIPGLAPSDYFAPLALSSLGRREAVAPGLVGAPSTATPEFLRQLADFIDDSVTSFFAERFSRPSGSRSTWRPERVSRRPAGITESALVPLPEPAIALDGRADERLWELAAKRPLARGELRVTSDAHYLYVAVRRTLPGRFSSEILIDADASREPSWAVNDWWLHSSNSLCAARGAYGRFEACGAANGWSATNTQNPRAGASGASGAGDAAEYAVSWRRLGLSGPPARLGLGVRRVEDAGAASWPETLTVDSPATWGTFEAAELIPGERR